MKREQRNKAIQRLEDLSLRLNALDGMLATELSSPFYRTQCDQIVTETKAEFAALERMLATSLEFLFNFKGGGWNSEVAYTEEEAIEQAITKYGHPDTQEMLKIDITTFRVSTSADHKNLMSMFY